MIFSMHTLCYAGQGPLACAFFNSLNVGPVYSPRRKSHCCRVSPTRRHKCYRPANPITPCHSGRLGCSLIQPRRARQTRHFGPSASTTSIRLYGLCMITLGHTLMPSRSTINTVMSWWATQPDSKLRLVALRGLRIGLPGYKDSSASACVKWCQFSFRAKTELTPYFAQDQGRSP